MVQFQKFHQNEIEVDPFGCGYLGSIHSVPRHLIDFLAIQHQVRGKSVLFVEEDVLILDRQKFLQSVYIGKDLVFKVLAEQQVLAQCGIKSYELTASQINGREAKYAAVTPRNQYILVPGGGFLGALWPNEEERFRRIVQAFHKQKIIVFPQTVTFDTTTPEGKKYLEESQQIYTSHPDLTIFVREKRSYAFMQQYFPTVRCLLVPDIVTLLRVPDTAQTRKGVLFCMRRDLEKALDDAAQQEISIRGHTSPFTHCVKSYMVRKRAFFALFPHHLAMIPLHRYNGIKGRWYPLGNKKKRVNTDPTLSMIRDVFQENLQLANRVQRKSKSDIITKFDLTEKLYARRIKAVAHLMPEMKARYADTYPEMDIINEFADIASLPILSYDIIDDEAHLCLGAVITRQKRHILQKPHLRLIFFSIKLEKHLIKYM